MDRQLIDKLLISLGVVVTLMLGAGAGLAYWGEKFSSSQIQSQLVQEKIFFPKAGDPAINPEEYPTLQDYAGTQVDSGDKAKAYADEFIWHHMMKMSGGKTYAEISAQSMANPQDTKLAALKSTLFQGDMLRSSLLTAYAFSRFGLIAHWATLALAAGAAVMLVLVILGLIHLQSITKKRRK